MLKFGLILVLLVGCLADQSTNEKEVGEKIENGVEADIREFPYIVSVHLKTTVKVQLCGGSIIGSSWVLSVAHCTQAQLARNLFVRAGTVKEEIGGRIHYVSNVINHPGFNSATSLENDISLLKVAKPFVYTTKIQPISLAPTGSSIAEGTLLKVAGWGLDSEGDKANVLLEARVPAVSNRVCARSYSGISIVSDSMLCAGYRTGGEGACQGDSGSPVVNGNVQVGVISWGVGCALPNYPVVSTRVSSFRDWIRQNSGV